ncbi:unnamed protein product [Zymoseptoria tritici ST99CH_3D7]|uniref:Zn(2)-C6 fungal-type domain-containing protein n=1 Tax=Zymoseptoria tritici (strain ST99CH_3D7) TaxID=1276538 RepID=A0A1X7S7P1_ZYMT9|nr:unnamed protein product [Zymoseptoria tritici ST99CH_3D7]
MHPSRASLLSGASRYMGASASREDDEGRSDYRVSDSRDHDRRASPPRVPDGYGSYGSQEPRPSTRYESYRPDALSFPANVRHAFRREGSDIDHRGRQRRDEFDYPRDDRYRDRYGSWSDGRKSPPLRRPAAPRSSPPPRAARSPPPAHDAVSPPPLFVRNLSWRKSISPPRTKRKVGEAPIPTGPARFGLAQPASAPPGLEGVPTAPKSMRDIRSDILQHPHIAISSQYMPSAIGIKRQLVAAVEVSHAPKFIHMDTIGFVIAFESDASGRDAAQRCFEGLQDVKLFQMYRLGDCMELYLDRRRHYFTQPRQDVPPCLLNKGAFLANHVAQSDSAIRGAAASGPTVNAAPLRVGQDEFVIRGAAVGLPEDGPDMVTAAPNSPKSRANSTVPPLQARLQRDTDSVSVASVPSASDSTGSKGPKCHVCKERTQKLLRCSTCPRYYDRRCLIGPQFESPEWQCPRCKRRRVPLKRRAPETSDTADIPFASEVASPAKKPRLAEEHKEPHKEAPGPPPARIEGEANPQAVAEIPETPAAVVTTTMVDALVADSRPVVGSAATATMTEGVAPIVRAKAQLADQERCETAAENDRPLQGGSAVEPSRYEAATSSVEEQVTNHRPERANAAGIDIDSDEAANLVDESFNSPERPAMPKKAKKLNLTRKVILPPANTTTGPPGQELPETTEKDASTETSTVSIAPEGNDTTHTDRGGKCKTGEGDAPAPLPDKVGIVQPHRSPEDPHINDNPSVAQENASRPSTTFPPQAAAEQVAKPEVPTNHLRDSIGSASPVDSVMTTENTRSFAKRTGSRSKPSKSIICIECKVIPVPSNPFGIKMCPECVKTTAAANTATPLSTIINGSRVSKSASIPPSRAPSVDESMAASAGSSRKVQDVMQDAPSLDEQHAAMVRLDASTTTACEDCRRKKQRCEHRLGASSTACSDCRRAHVRCEHNPAERQRKDHSTTKGKTISDARQPPPDVDFELDQNTSMVDANAETDERQDENEPSTDPRHRRKRRKSASTGKSPTPFAVPVQRDKDPKSTGVRGLGNSFSRPPGVYRQLICMAMCDTPGRRLTCRGAAEWIAKNIPGYELGQSNWAENLKATMYGQEAVVDKDKRYLRRLDWKPSFGGKPKTLWFGLIPGLEKEVEHWDPTLGQPVSPVKQSQAGAREQSQRREQDDQHTTPSKSKRRTRPVVEDDEVSVDGGSVSVEPEIEPDTSGGASHNSDVDETAGVDSTGQYEVDERPNPNTADEESLLDICERSFQAPPNHEDTVMEDALVALSASGPSQDIGAALALLDHVMDHDNTAPTFQQQTAPIAPMQVTHRPFPPPTHPPSFPTTSTDAPFDRELWNIIRDMPPEPNTSTNNLAEAYPQYFFDRAAKIAEIKARPTRKQQINARMKKLYGKGCAVVDTTEMRERERKQVRKLDTEGGLRSLPGEDVSTLKNCATVEEFLGLDLGLVMDVVDKQVVFRKNDGGRSRTIYKTGL